MIDKENLLSRISSLIKMPTTAESLMDKSAEIYASTLSISSILWGSSSPQVEAVKQIRADMLKTSNYEEKQHQNIKQLCRGILKSYASDIEAGRLGKLQLEYQGQVYSDMLSSAKAALENGVKDVGAVLTASALEDVMKQYAAVNGLDVDGRDLSHIVGALKAAGLLSATRGSLVLGMVPFRNKAMHAEWSKIDELDVKTVIAFVESFLIEAFVT